MTRRGEVDEFPFDVCYVEISTMGPSLGMKLDIKVKKWHILEPEFPAPLSREDGCRIDLGQKARLGDI